MKPYCSRVFIYNRAPFDKIDLSFEENGISVLTGVNGQGKTTIISYMVDSWYELVRNYYPNEFKGNEGTYYRISTSLYVLDSSKPSIVYIRYLIDGQYVDYLNIEAGVTELQYNEIVPFQDKIPFGSIRQKENKSQRVKQVSENVKKELIYNWLDNNVMTCFPSFRYELPYYINDFFKDKFVFKKDSDFNGFLNNPLLVVSGIDGITNWIMDIVLDMELYGRQASDKLENILWDNMSSILTAELNSKKKGLPVRFGLGRRNSGAARISVVRKDNGAVIYPSIYGMSSGELSVLAIFLEIIRQADKIKTNTLTQNIQGIVLIDEIDKHLHIKLQKELLPSMLALFPNVQFILSTHSPFLTMGLAENEKARVRTEIIDLDQCGLMTEPQSIAIYNEVYDMMVDENNNYKQLYDKLQGEMKNAARPLVITEGKTDTKHIRNAMQKLRVPDVDVEFFEIGNLKWGNSELRSMLESCARLDNQRKIIGVFDRDVDEYVEFSTSEGRDYKCLRPGSNVYAFCIPLVNEEEYGPNISIEHYYHLTDLLKEDSNHRRLFLGKEFHVSGNSKDGQYQTRYKNIQYKVQVNGIIDEKVYKRDDLELLNSIALSKDAFAELVCGDSDYAADFDLSNFEQIINVMREICSL